MIDIAKIKIKAGNGGDGAVSFRREKFIPFGGPDGGDGGRGGDVYFVASDNLSTLRDFRSKEVFGAEDGEKGGKKKMFGLSKDDLYIKVPTGTLIYVLEGEKETLIGDLTEHNEQLLVAKGGKGGTGNFRFRSSTNQAPRQYTPGGKGEEKEIKLEIKLVADVGLIGFPNAGKSTFINKITNANAKVANYPFTTLSPNLGSYRLKSGQDIVLSDIPGLIEGASEGKGLGDEFLRHIERTRILIHFIDPIDGVDTFEERDLVENALKRYQVIRNELDSYGHDLLEKREIIAINKMDVTEVKNTFEAIKKEFEKKKLKAFGISSISGEGIEELMEEVLKILEEMPERPKFSATKPVKLFNINNLPNKKMVFDESTVITLEE